MSKYAMSKFSTVEARAEAMGYDAGRNGPNTENCRYSSFSTPEEKAAWELGLERGMKETDADRAMLANGEIPAHIASPDLTAKDVRRLLERVIKRAGSQKATAMEAGCSYAFLNNVLHGRREPSGPLLDALGLERVVIYRAKLRNVAGGS